MSMLSYVVASDFRLSDRLLDWTPPRWFRFWMLSATRLGDGWLWLSAAVCLAACGSESQRRLAAAAGSAGLANLGLVLVKGRGRGPPPGGAGRRVRPGTARSGAASRRHAVPRGAS